MVTGRGKRDDEGHHPLASGSAVEIHPRSVISRRRRRRKKKKKTSESVQGIWKGMRRTFTWPLDHVSTTDRETTGGALVSTS